MPGENSGPAVPDFASIGAGASTPKTAKKTAVNPDIFGLGQAYGKPVYLGQQAEAHNTEHGGGSSMVTEPTPAFGQTQQLMQQASHLWSSDPQQYEALQAQLAQAGYYGTSGKYTPGRFDSKTQSALRSMLKDYEGSVISNNIPMTVDEFLQQNIASTQAAQQADAKPPPQIDLTDPTAIRAAAQQAFQAATGQAATESQLDTFVSQFQGAQASAQTSTGSSISVPDLSSDATAFAQKSNPHGYAQYKTQGYENALLDMFLPSESQRPNITPTPVA